MSHLDEIREIWSHTTPGPWEVCPMGIYVLAPSGMVADLPLEGRVARIRGTGSGQPQAANLRAIAAAPAHIAYLIKLVEKLEADWIAFERRGRS